ncbi:hypothetical protein NDU88_002962 [Pleurodeles waltl]|uniref:Uncharacterized protein n=1 Tax=Pleurodeles waltl TaxID=8319 RepID=A0AAV7KUA1_PLEWA|nr:hypothetical protein NDU88_002962 [Pleurodeles waltl]
MAPRVRPPASFPLVGVFTGGARFKGTPPPPSPRMASSRAVPCPPGVEDPVTPRAGRPRSPTDPVPLAFRSAASPFPRSQRGEAPPAASQRLRQLLSSNACSGPRAPARSIGRFLFEAWPGPRDGLFPASHGTSELRTRAHRIREAPRQSSLADGI